MKTETTQSSVNEIICPSCNKAFKVDEAGYASILKQVRNQEFDEELQKELKNAAKEKESALALSEEKLKSFFEKQLAQKDSDLEALKAQSEIVLRDNLNSKETEINQLKAKIEQADNEKKLALNDAVQTIEKERDALLSDIKIKDLEKENLKSALEQKLSAQLQNKDAIIKYKDDEIARIKEMKQKLSTKMLGETLEQHCEIEFNKLRPMAFQKAYFEKDNDANSGSKGDYIYRENDDEGNEIISIMFEMKNEGDETISKKKNEDFLKELDKDRTEKKCEYAVLVSCLEADSDYYNSGIVDVSLLVMR